VKRIPSLDGLRAISITNVVVAHLLASLSMGGRLSPAIAGMVQGFQGVFVFFVISGYLITTLLLREYERAGTLRLGRFYYRRFFRIVPPLYAYILIAALWLGPALGIHAERREILTALTFTRNLDFHPHQFLFEHFWSLSIEEQFYIVWPLTLLAVLRRRGRAAAGRIAVALIVLSAVYRLAVFALIPFQPFRIFVNWLLPGHLDSLMFGCWAALAQGSPRFEALYRRITRWPWLLPLWAFVGSTALMDRFGNMYYLSLGHTLDGIAVTFGMLWAIRNADSAAGRVLNSRPLVHLGVLSYSLYIWQNSFVNPHNHTLSGRFPWNILCPLLAAQCSWMTVERASLWLRDRWEPRLFRSRAEGEAASPLRDAHAEAAFVAQP
jgi:peptidoglycan/LPS O-acetylase OafA/YrhL